MKEIIYDFLKKTSSMIFLGIFRKHNVPKSFVIKDLEGQAYFHISVGLFHAINCK